MKINTNAIILTLGAILSLYFAATLPIWYDEAITILEINGYGLPELKEGLLTFEQAAFKPSEKANIHGISSILIESDVHPPLYYIAAFGISELINSDYRVVRLLSVTSIFLAMLLLVRSQKFSKAGTVALIIVFFLPSVQWASFNARGYGLAIFFCTGAIVYLNEFLKDKKFENLSVSYLFWGLAILTHYFTILLAPFYIIFGFHVYLRSCNIKFKSACALIIILGMPLIMVLPFLLNQIGSRPNQYSGFTNLSNELILLLDGFVNIFNSETILYPSIDSIRAIICSIMIFAVILLCLLYKPSRQYNYLYSIHIVGILSFLFLLLLLFALTDKTFSIGSAQRYFSFIVPSLFFVLVGALNYLYQKFNLSKSITILTIMGFSVNYSFNFLFVDLKPLPWGFETRYQYLVLSYHENENELSCILAPKGHGRGTPISALLNMEPDSLILFLDHEKTLDSQLENATECTRYQIYYDETKRIKSADIIQKLREGRS